MDHGHQEMGATLTPEITHEQSGSVESSVQAPNLKPKETLIGIESPVETRIAEVRHLIAEQQHEPTTFHSRPTSNNEYAPPQKKSPFINRLKATTLDAVWTGKLLATSIIQLGGLHPWRSNGKWVWVLEPWANIHDDPRQSSYSTDSQFYSDKFRGSNSRILDLDKMGLETPKVTLDGPGLVQLLDHRRIREAKRSKKAIVVNVENFHGLPKTLN